MMEKKTRLVKDILWFCALWGLVAGVLRMWFGLGATTNMSDSVPWGIWKILNMVAGVALSTSGFSVGFLVIVLRIERFRPLLKPAILVAFLGYGASCFALLFDIGLPHRFWHPLFMWNEHSFLFEVFWCVMLYFTVTFIEMVPNFLERFRAEKAVRFLHRISFGVVVFGISLSSLHHSSLGSLFLVTPERLHPLWYSSWLPIFFILSAIGAGMMFVILVRILYARWYDPEPVFGDPDTNLRTKICATAGIGSDGTCAPPRGKDIPLLRGLSVIAAGVLGLYLFLKVIALFVNGSWRHLVAGTWESYLFTFELLIAAVIPIVLIANPRTRNTPFGLGLAGFCASSGLALNRLDVGIFGYFSDAGTVYFPSLIEWTLAIGVIAAAGLTFFFIVENFSIFDRNWQKRTISKGFFRVSYDTLLRAWNTNLVGNLPRVTLIAVFTLPVAAALMYPPYSKGSTVASSVQPAIGLDSMRETLRIDGDRSGLYTDFPHADHQRRLGEESSCALCHHVSKPGDKSTSCSECHGNIVEETTIFDHFLHMKLVASREEKPGWYPSNHSCSTCHGEGEPKTARNAKDCMECHEKDMWLIGRPDEGMNLMEACSYQEAMHRSCIPCHEKEGKRMKFVNLEACTTCHPSMRHRTMIPGKEISEVNGDSAPRSENPNRGNVDGDKVNRQR